MDRHDRRDPGICGSVSARACARAASERSEGIETGMPPSRPATRRPSPLQFPDRITEKHGYLTTPRPRHAYQDIATTIDRILGFALKTTSRPPATTTSSSAPARQSRHL